MKTKNVLLLVLICAGILSAQTTQLIVFQKLGIKDTIRSSIIDSIKFLRNTTRVPVSHKDSILSTKKYFMEVYTKAVAPSVNGTVKSFVLANIDSIPVQLVGGSPVAYVNILNKKVYHVGDTIQFTYKLNLASSGWVRDKHVLMFSADSAGSSGALAQINYPNDPSKSGGALPGGVEPQMPNIPGAAITSNATSHVDGVYIFNNGICVWDSTNSTFTWKYIIVDPYKPGSSSISKFCRIRVGVYDFFTTNGYFVNSETFIVE